MSDLAIKFLGVLVLGFVGLFLACSGAHAQGLAVAFDTKGKPSPAVLLPVWDFDEVLGFRVKSSIVAFAGSSVDQGKVTGGGAWTFDFPLAKGSQANLRAFMGPSLTFEKGVPAKLGFVVGVRW